MKKDYNKPELNITSFEANDVISLSAKQYSAVYIYEKEKLL